MERAVDYCINTEADIKRSIQWVFFTSYVNYNTFMYKKMTK